MTELGVPHVARMDARAAMVAMTHKTDRNDARGLDQMLRTGWFRQVPVKARRTMELRTLLTIRKTLVLKIGDVENQIRGSLCLFEIKLGTAKRRTFSERVRELTAGLPRVAAILDVLLQPHTAMLLSLDRLTRTVFPTIPPLVDYEFTPLGRRLTEPLGVLAAWAQTHLPEMEDARRAYAERKETEAAS